MAIAFTCHPSLLVLSVASTIVGALENIIATALKSHRISRVVFYITTVRLRKFSGTTGFLGDYEIKLASLGLMPTWPDSVGYWQRC